MQEKKILHACLWLVNVKLEIYFENIGFVDCKWSCKGSYALCVIQFCSLLWTVPCSCMLGHGWGRPFPLPPFLFCSVLKATGRSMIDTFNICPWDSLSIQVSPFGDHKTYFCKINFHFITSHMQHFLFPRIQGKGHYAIYPKSEWTPSRMCPSDI